MNPYYEQMILNAEPGELIRLLYQRAISSVREAREHLAHKRIAERSKAVSRAYAAIEQLIVALRPENAPELCSRLQGLYVYVQQRLLDANMQQADGPMAEVLAKQGMPERARAVYEKLSLLNPDKRAYFASKIEQLNIH